MSPYNKIFDKFDFVFGRPWLFKRAKRPNKLIQDSEANQSISQNVCKICLTNTSCILFRNCNHVGTCNRCCYTYLNEGFFYNKYKRAVVKQSAYPFYKTYVPNWEHFQYHKKCPFCNALITGIEYVYLM